MKNSPSTLRKMSEVKQTKKQKKKKKKREKIIDMDTDIEQKVQAEGLWVFPWYSPESKT